MKTKLFMIAAAFAAMLLLAGLVSAQKCTEPGSIKRVTKTRSGNFEYVTFEVLSADPDYKVSNAKPPFSEYGSEKRLRITGPYYKSVVIKGIFWTCKIGENFSARTSAITAVKSVEQFEGQAEYIIGYKAKSKFVSSYATGTGDRRNVTLKFKR